MEHKHYYFYLAAALLLFTPLYPLSAQESPTPAEEPEIADPVIRISAGNNRQTFTGRNIPFDISGSEHMEDVAVQEVLWDFGDQVRTTGEKVNHAYENPGAYTVRATVTTGQGTFEDSIEVAVFDTVTILLTDSSAPENEIDLMRQQAARENMLLLALRARSGGPEVLVEDELTNQLIDARDAIARASLIFVRTSGSIGANALSRFGQHLRQSEELSFSDLGMERKGVVMLSDTPFGVLAPTAQSAYNQLQPSYIILTRPEILSSLLEPLTPEAAQEIIIESPIPHRLVGSFSARATRDISITNFMSFGINFLVNRGVPINNIVLILMLPVIATILSFSRQVIGIKAFGIITPAMTTLSFLVIGLKYGLIVFSAILLAGTLTRIVMRKLRLLYLPRMALVLTSVSFAILALFGVGVAIDENAFLSFSIFPIIILTLLAEEFIAVQFKVGARKALTITMWTILLSVICYFIVSWQLLRTIVLSYPEVTLLTIPVNILLGRWGGLRLTEYFRFRKLLRYTQ